MNFVSCQQLLADIRAWSQRLPADIVAVAGVPRSGVLAAAHLALERNIHLVTLDDLERGLTPWRSPLRRGVAAQSSGMVLVLDDTLHSGGTLTAVRRRLARRNDVKYGAMYYTEWLPEVMDFGYRQLSQPRCFEWNLFHSDHLGRAGVDLDGVLCADWLGVEDDAGHGQAEYLRHVESATPLRLPTYPVMAVVTSRLEKYRPQTIGWLRRHGVLFRELVMSPHPTASARRAAGDHGRRKALWYGRRTEAGLFVESDRRQAEEIARLTARPVLCTDGMQLIGTTRGSAAQPCQDL